jgi:hypothetical protein
MLRWLFRLLTGQKPALVMTPDQVVQYALRNFDKTTEAQLAKAEYEVKLVVRNSPESGLLYAMRVSKCVPRITTFKTLASRWRVANYGPRLIGGMCSAKCSRSYGPTYEFLTSLYLGRFRELARDLVVTAENTALERKTLSAKQNVLVSAMGKIRAGRDNLLELPGIRDEANRWLEHLKHQSLTMRDRLERDTKKGTG